MDEDRIKGAAKELGGKVKGAAGELTGDTQTQAEAKVTELKGSAQNLYGQAKDTLSDAAGQAREFAGDAFDRARERYPDAQRLYRQGSEALRPHAPPQCSCPLPAPEAVPASRGFPAAMAAGRQSFPAPWDR